MKLKTIIVMALAATISASAGAFDREEILKDVAKMNAEMPMSMGMMGTMTSISVSGDTIVYNGIIDGLGSLNLGSDNSIKFKNYLLNNIAILNEFSVESGVWYENIADNNMYVKHHLENPHTGQIRESVISPSDLQKALDNDPDYKFLTDYMIESTKSTLPMEVGAMKIVEAKLEGNNYVITAIVDEDVISMDQMIANQAMMKENYLNVLKMRTELRALIDAYTFAKNGYGQSYVYKGSKSGKQTSYQVSADEILKAIGK